MIHQKGYWVGQDCVCHHLFDKELAYNLAIFFAKEGGTVCDLGCGMGDYVNLFLKHDIKAIGFDGNPSTPELSKGSCKVLDLSVPIIFDPPFDWILSLEVGEHLPKEYESIFIENVMKNNKKGVIISWAIKGQGGWGHFNEQNNDYIKTIFAKHGYINDIVLENKLREGATQPYFKWTIMVFRNPNA